MIYREPRGNVRGTSAVRSAASPSNRLFSHIMEHKVRLEKDISSIFPEVASQHWNLALKQGTYSGCTSQSARYGGLPEECGGGGVGGKVCVFRAPDPPTNRLQT